MGAYNRARTTLQRAIDARRSIPSAPPVAPGMPYLSDEAYERAQKTLAEERARGDQRIADAETNVVSAAVALAGVIDRVAEAFADKVLADDRNTYKLHSSRLRDEAERLRPSAPAGPDDLLGERGWKALRDQGARAGIADERTLLMKVDVGHPGELRVRHEAILRDHIDEIAQMARRGMADPIGQRR
ncbi:hypothetical protein [Baekduia alba]|uniref:hypothetical protein n=1 Tax=Baekduia alba TaxID=2997333 RepID=UPI002340E971|nr:hypothetical protein [Baekduia alba]